MTTEEIKEKVKQMMKNKKEDKCSCICYSKNCLINSILVDLDFDTIHKVMIHLDWNWRDAGVPSKEQLKETVTSLLESVYEAAKKDKKHHSHETGGFRAESSIVNGHIELRASFEVTNASAPLY